MQSPRRTLRARIATGLLAYSVLLGAGILLQGYLTNEQIEQVLWRTLLTQEAEHFEGRRAADPAEPLPRTRALVSYESPSDRLARDIPPSLQGLAPGLHDDITVDGRDMAVLVRDRGGRRLYMAIDISGLEAAESSLMRRVLASSLLGLAVLVGAIWWLAGRMLRPVSEFAAQFDDMRPDVRGERVEIADAASLEVATIAGAMNRYLERQEDFVIRERAFINTMSHELRTPVAVMRGAAELIGEVAELPVDVRKPLQRIRRTLDNVEELIAMLLVLAREPERFEGNQETIRLENVLPDIVLAHAHLMRDKDLHVEIGSVEPGPLHAPMQVVETAIANLLRNAIESSDHGVIRIEVRPTGVVRIQDPGHGMSPTDIGRLYSSSARAGDSPSGAGIGLALIRRICEHLGWRLELSSEEGQGTLAVLDVRASLRPDAPHDPPQG